MANSAGNEANKENKNKSSFSFASMRFVCNVCVFPKRYLEVETERKEKRKIFLTIRNGELR